MAFILSLLTHFSLLTSFNAHDTLQAMSRATEFLLQSQNADGGWGYRVGGMSYVEPTAAAMHALKNAEAKDSRQRARDFLLSIQQRDGGWGIGMLDSESGWMTAWAVFVLADFPEVRDAVARGAAWLINTVGLRVSEEPARANIRDLFRIDSTLRGWPWQVGDAAWVHPTALAILGLIAAGKREEARVREGVEYLYDRSAAEGGWNIGNPQMIDKKIPATIHDTAIALLALRTAGEGLNAARVAAGIQFLRNAIARAKTPAELAWGIYSLQGWNIDTGDAIARLNALQSPDGSWQHNPFITAIAILAQPNIET